jgi:protein gp37
VNKQKKGNGKLGIEWCDYTHNPITGCQHGCRWEMLDGSVAQCYAKSVAEGVASAVYPGGFEAHGFHPERLDDPLKVKQPSRIFVGSMSDVFGHWVPSEQIHAILDACRRAPQHQFQLLTKNPVRIAKFADAIPPNVWLGASMPPTFMWGRRLTEAVQIRILERTVKALSQLSFLVPNVIWMSLEPLSFEVSPTLRQYVASGAIHWLVIGAASNGRTTYQPDPRWVTNVLDYADNRFIPVFFKGNLEWSPRREEFPNARVAAK